MATAANLNSTTLEQQLLELIERIRDKQEAKDANGLYTKNPNGIMAISNYNINGLSGEMECTINLPVNISIDGTNGALRAIATAIYDD